MTPSMLGKYNRFFGIVVVIAIFSVSILSTIHFGMDTSSAEAMSDCPFAATQGLCAMDNPIDHASMWRGLLAVFPVPAMALMFFAAVIALASFLFFSPYLLFELLHSIVRVRLRYLSYAFSHPPRSLAEAFSNGILNPKLF